MQSNRRQFLKTGLFSAAAAVAGTSICAQAAQAPRRWDKTADIVIVGFGGAGAVGAISAAQAGSSVLILEKNAEAGHLNNTRMSGGNCHCPEKTGNKDALKAYCIAMFSGENIPGHLEGEQAEWSERLADIWVKYCPDNMDFMRSLDPDFNASVLPGYNKAAFSDFPGAKESGYSSFLSIYGKRAKGFNTPTWKLEKNETNYGEAFWRCLLEGIKKQGDKIAVEWGTPARHLVRNDAGEVIGVIAEHNGKEVAVRAKKAVFLTCGGWEYSVPLRKAFLDGNPISGWTFYGTPSNTGDGIIMAQEIGAGLLKPGKVAARLIIPTQKTVNGMRIGTITPAVGSPHSIVVDNFGNRYAAENLITKNPSAYFFYKEATKFDITNLTYPRSPSWMIFDETLRTSKPLVNLGISTVGFDLVEWDKKNEKPIESGLIIKADTIQALAEKIRMRRENANRMDAETLVRTVETFNKACDLKKDEALGRLPNTLGKIEKGPFYAVEVVPGGPNTKGGLNTDGDRRVLTWNDEVIPRLFAFGEIASVHKNVYQGGGNLAECIVFGRHCGELAAKLPETKA